MTSKCSFNNKCLYWYTLYCLVAIILMPLVVLQFKISGWQRRLTGCNWTICKWRNPTNDQWHGWSWGGPTQTQSSIGTRLVSNWHDLHVCTIPIDHRGGKRLGIGLNLLNPRKMWLFVYWWATAIEWPCFCAAYPIVVVLVWRTETTTNTTNKTLTTTFEYAILWTVHRETTTKKHCHQVWHSCVRSIAPLPCEIFLSHECRYE